MSRSAANFKDRMEYGGLLLFDGLFRVLPYHACVALAWLIARFAFHVLRWRRAETVRRIMSVTDADAKEAKRIAYVSLRNCLATAAEIMHRRTLDDAWIRRHVTGAEESAATLLAHSSPALLRDDPIADTPCAAQGSAPRRAGVVLALPHIGNWYLAGCIMAKRGVPMYAVAGRQRNPLSNAWMNRRLYGGMTIFERGSSAIRDCIKALRSGGVMAILPDVRMKTPDLSVPFLGGMANVGRGMAAFARKTGSPIIVARLRRNGLTRHEFALSDPIEPNPSLPAEEDILRMTTIVLAGIDKRIREEPEQWFWYNKRWVLDPV